MIKKRLIIIFVACWLPLYVVYAMNAPNLYLVTIPVPTQSDEAREQAVKTGFMQMLVKLSGNPQIAVNPLIKENVPRADYYVQTFSYSTATMASSEYYLQIHYDKADVDRLLKKANAHSWNDKRPLLLLWLAVADKKTSIIVGNDAANNLLNTVMNKSKQYGLPMILPLLDMTDLNQVAVNDVTDMHLSILQTAAKRYAPDGLLIGKIKQNAKEVHSQWILLLNDKQWRWRLVTPLRANAINNIVDAVLAEVSQTLAAEEANPALIPPNNWMKLEVSRATEKHGMLHILAYLQQKFFSYAVIL